MGVFTTRDVPGAMTVQQAAASGSPDLRATGTVYTGERTATNYGFVDVVAHKNVELTIASIRQRSSVLTEMEKAHAIVIAGAMYNLETGAVDFFPLK
jgi:carbonic anhydrase